MPGGMINAPAWLRGLQGKPPVPDVHSSAFKIFCRRGAPPELSGDDELACLDPDQGAGKAESACRIGDPRARALNRGGGRNGLSA